MALNTLPNEGLTNRGYPSDRIVTPIIINGDMSVAQRGTSSTGQTGAGYKTVDRIRLSPGGGMTFTVEQASESPTGQGFTKSYKVTSTTGDATMTAAEYNIPLQMRMEGSTLQSIKKGTSNAEKITFAFWVYATVTGTYVLELSDDDNNRYNSQSYTVSSSNTWEKKIVNFPADTTGAFDNDNAKSLTINFWGGAGSDFSSGTLQTTWTSGTDANRAAGQVNAFASNNNVWQITGLQLEVGEFDSTSIPSFPFESHENNLRKCQRYYYFLGGVNDTYKRVSTNITNPNNRNQTAGLHYLPVPMRDTPSVTIPAASSFNGVYIGGSNSFSSMTIGNQSEASSDADFSVLRVTGTLSGNVGNHCVQVEMTYGSTNKMEVSAEL